MRRYDADFKGIARTAVFQVKDQRLAFASEPKPAHALASAELASEKFALVSSANTVTLQACNVSQHRFNSCRYLEALERGFVR